MAIQAMHSLDRETALVHAAQNGDWAAFGELYEANVAPVYRYLRARRVEPADAEDLTAEVFVKAREGLRSYRPQGKPLVAWLFRIAHNEMVTFLRRRDRRREVLVEGDGGYEAMNDPAEEAMLHVQMEEVREAMQALTPLQQEVVSLRFGAELSLKETAAAMGRSEGAVKFLQHSALKSLQGRLHAEERDAHE